MNELDILLGQLLRALGDQPRRKKIKPALRQEPWIDKRLEKIEDVDFDNFEIKYIEYLS